MKRSSLVIKLAATFISLAAISSGFLTKAEAYSKASALTQRRETYAYNEMVGNCSMISGYDITPSNSSNELVSYGFRYGDVASNNINQFTSFGDNRLGQESSGTFFLNWRMSTANNVGSIIMFKAHVKSDINITRAKIGADWKDNITLSIYKDSELLSSKALSDKDTTSDDFNFDITLDVGETLYWQILTNTPESRHISMDSSGADWSTLPRFTVTEWVKKDTSTTSYNDFYNNLTSNTSGSDGKVSYKIREGSLYPNNLSDVSLYGFGNSGELSVTANPKSLFIEFSATTLTSLVFDWTNAEVLEGSTSFRYVIYYSSMNRHKVAYVVNGEDISTSDLSQKLVLNQNDRLYIEFIRTDSYKVKLFDSFTTTQLTSNDDLSSLEVN